MSVTVVRHDPADHPGWISLALDSVGLSWHYWDGDEVPQALLILGGSGSANDSDLAPELALIRGALLRDVPVLGVCLGAQLAAKALGSNVYANLNKEIGWAPVQFTSDARDDGIFAGFSQAETVFHWHADTFDLPAGAVRLASSEMCVNQAFRYGEVVYGLQFHLEATPDIIDRWQQEDRACAIPELNQPIDPHAHQLEMSRLASVVFGRWASLVASRCASSRA